MEYKTGYMRDHSLLCHLFLIGFMGVGKSTVGERLGTMLGMTVVELDRRIEERNHKSVAQIFEEQGEAWFREQESVVLESLKEEVPAIISCGGGIILSASNRIQMRQSGQVILLTASPETVFERLKHDDQRPLLKNKKDISFIRELMEQRRAAYEETATLTVDTNHRTVQQVCDALQQKLLSGGLIR